MLNYFRERAETAFKPLRPNRLASNRVDVKHSITKRYETQIARNSARVWDSEVFGLSVACGEHRNAEQNVGNAGHVNDHDGASLSMAKAIPFPPDNRQAD